MNLNELIKDKHKKVLEYLEELLKIAKKEGNKGKIAAAEAKIKEYKRRCFN